MAAEFTVNFNPNAVMARIEGAEEAALFVTSEQVLEDSNFYCPQDVGTLMGSAITNSVPEQGIVQWVMPYAQYLYYGTLMVAPNGSSWAKKGETKSVTGVPLAFSHDKNPNASMLWFEKAKDIHGKEWAEIYEKTLKGGI